MQQQQDVRQIQRFNAQRMVLRAVEDFGSESTLMFCSGVMAWIVGWPPDTIFNLPFYQALTNVAPAALWAGGWWLMTLLVLGSLVFGRRRLRSLAMALLVFSWFFTGVVLLTATTPASILAPFAFVFSASALCAWWRLAIREARAQHE